MLTFSNDTDILKYEPGLFGELRLPGDVLVTGTGGQIRGTWFTAPAANFIHSQVPQGGVIYLRCPERIVDGPYEIVSVDSPTKLTISVVRADPRSESVGPPPASDVEFCVTTFAARAAEVAFALTQYLGIRPGNPASDIDGARIPVGDSLRRASVFGIIADVCDILARNELHHHFWQKRLYYRALFAKAKEQCKVKMSLVRQGELPI